MERRQIVALWQQSSGGVLVTLVRVEGSSYRRPGAMLLAVAAGALHAGTISGGCLESEVIRRAAWIARDHAAVERYATTFDDTADIPFGLGCGGTVELLFEPVAAPEGVALLQAIAGSIEGREATVVSFLPGDGRTLRRVIFDNQGGVAGLPSPQEAADKLKGKVDEVGRNVQGAGSNNPLSGNIPSPQEVRLYCFWSTVSS